MPLSPELCFEVSLSLSLSLSLGLSPSLSLSLSLSLRLRLGLGLSLSLHLRLRLRCPAAPRATQAAQPLGADVMCTYTNTSPLVSLRLSLSWSQPQP